MAAYTDSHGFNKGTAAAYLASGNNRTSVMSVVLDFAAIKAARADAGATALATSDTLEVLRIPAGTVVLSAGYTVTSAETVNATGTVKLDDGAVNYAAATAVNGLKTVAANLANPTVISAADAFKVTIGTAVPEDAVVRVWAVMANVG